MLNGNRFFSLGKNKNNATSKRRLQLETLEDRTLLAVSAGALGVDAPELAANLGANDTDALVQAQPTEATTLTVTNASNSLDQGSFIWAINQTIINPNDDFVINFDPNFDWANNRIYIWGGSEGYGIKCKSLTIDASNIVGGVVFDASTGAANNSPMTDIKGSHFTIGDPTKNTPNSTVVTLKGMILTGANGFSCYVRSGGALTMVDCVVADNHGGVYAIPIPDAEAGAATTSVTVNIYGSTFTGNHGDAIFSHLGTERTQSGKVWNQQNNKSTINIYDSIILGNEKGAWGDVCCNSLVNIYSSLIANESEHTREVARDEHNNPLATINLNNCKQMATSAAADMFYGGNDIHQCYRVNGNSPAAGTAQQYASSGYTGYPATDLAGVAWSQYRGYGAYEAFSMPTVSASVSNVNTTYTGNTVYANAPTVSDPNSGYTVKYDGSTTRPGFTNAGTYTVTVTVSAPGYDDWTGTETITINKANFSVSASNATYTYDGQRHAPTLSGVQSGDTVYYSLNNSNWSTNAPVVNVGTQLVYVKVTRANYNDAYAQANVTINPGTFSVTATGYEGTYDGNAHGITLSGTKSGDTIYYSTDNATWQSAPITVTNVADSKTIYVKVSRANYNDAYAQANVTINPADLEQHVTAESYYGAYDGNAHSVSVSCDVAGAEVRYRVAGESWWSLDNPSFVNVGDYTIEIQVTAPNYEPASRTETVGIYKADLYDHVTASGYEGNYDGDAHSITVTCDVADAVIYYRENEAQSWSTTNPAFTNPGTYNVQFKVEAPNYETYQSGATVEIIQRTFTVTATGYEGIYDGAAHGITLSGTQAGDTIYYSTDNATWQTAPITVTNVADSKTIYVKVSRPDYNDAFASAAVTLSARSVSVADFAVADKVYDGSTAVAASQLSWSLNNVASADAGKVGVNVNAGAYSSKHAGEYTINASYALTFTDPALSGNYTLAGNSGSATSRITAKTITLTGSATVDDRAYDGTTTVYDSQIDETGVGLNGVVAGDNVEVELDSVSDYASANVGEYDLTLTFVIESTLSRNDYVLSGATLGATSSITEANAEDHVEAVGYNGTYDGDAHSISVTCDLEGAVITYREAGESYWGANPAFTDAGTYTVEFKVEIPNYETVYGTETVEIAKADAEGDVEAVGYNGTYDGNAHSITVTCDLEGAVITYREAGESYWGANPAFTDAGTYTVEYKVEIPNYETVYGTETVTITADNLEDHITAAGYTGIYDGNAHSISVACDVAGSTILYRLAGETEWSSENPAFADLGTYTVEYKVSADNYTPVESSETVTINSNDLADYVTAYGYTGTYDAEAHSITVICSAAGATISYRAAGTEEWSLVNPEYTACGIYDVEYKVEGAGYISVSGTESVKIAELPSLVVTTLDDVVDIYDGLTSLREAMAFADGGTITFAEDLALGTIRLADGAVLTAGKAMTIDTEGKLITVDAQDASSVFEIAADTTIKGLVIENGCSETNGGAITVDAGATLNLIGCAVIDSSAANYGGAIYSAGTLYVQDSILDGNDAVYGGGIFAEKGTMVTVDGSSFHNNTATLSGGAIYMWDNSSLEMTNTSVTANTTEHYASGAVAVFNASAVLVNDVIADNNGGGLFVKARNANCTSTIIATNTTVTGNTVGAYQWLGSIEFYNSIVLLNGMEINGTVGGDSNLSSVEFGTNCILSNGEGVFVENSCELAADSAAIDVGVNAYIEGYETDYAGETRIVNDIVDLGAYEFQNTDDFVITLTGWEGVCDGAAHTITVDGLLAGDKVTYTYNETESEDAPSFIAPGTYTISVKVERAGYSAWTGSADVVITPAGPTVVTTLADTIDDTDGLTSLREALAASAAGLGDTVTFAAGLDGGTIYLVDGVVELADNVTIDAGDLSITIDANQKSAIFDVKADVALKNLQISNGFRTKDGGAVSVAKKATLTVDGCAFSGSKSRNYGGAIYNGGTLVVSNSDFSGNEAHFGAGIFADKGTSVTITDSTFTYNTAALGGAAVYMWNNSSLTMSGSKLLNNTIQTEENGVLSVFSAHADVTNTIIADNDGVGAGIFVAIRPFTKESSTLNATNVTVAGNTVGLLQLSGDANFFNSIILGNGTDINGTAVGDYNISSEAFGTNCLTGAAEDVFTGYGYVPAEGSAAVDAGLNSYIEGFDTDCAGNQRIVNDVVDLGAFEYQDIPVIADVTVTGWEGVCDGAAHSVTVDGLLEWDEVLYEYNGCCSTENPEFVAVGTYEVTVIVNREGCEQFEETVTVEITPAAATVVTTLADVVDAEDGLTSLREAVAAADADNAVTFASGLFGGTIYLNEAITIDGTVTIDGEGSLIEIDGQNATALFNVTGDAVLKDLGMCNGYAKDGGAITVAKDAALTIDNSYFYNCEARNYGGVIYNAGTLNVFKSQFTSNESHYGGAIFSDKGTEVTIDGSIFTTNRASYGGGAVYMWDHSVLTMTNTVVAGNYTGRSTSGAVVLFAATGDLTNVLVFNNTGVGLYAGTTRAGQKNKVTLTGTNVTVTGNTTGVIATNDGAAGALYEAKFFNSIILGNELDRDGYMTGDTNMSSTIFGTNCAISDAADIFDESGFIPAPNSAAIDAGINAYIEDFDTDVFGNPRIVNEIVDLGAAEFQFLASESEDR